MSAALHVVMEINPVSAPPNGELFHPLRFSGYGNSYGSLFKFLKRQTYYCYVIKNEHHLNHFSKTNNSSALGFKNVLYFLNQSGG